MIATTKSLVFKNWVPEWLVRINIFMIFFPNLLLFAISSANVSAACGYYGITPGDAQFSLVILYASYACYFPLERRFSSFFVTKDYLLLGIGFEVLIVYACSHNRNLPLLLFLRFVQGIFNCSVASACVRLIFSRLQKERSLKIGYSIVYGSALSISPAVVFVTAPFIDVANYNQIFIIPVCLLVPGVLLFCVTMTRERLKRKIPLYQLDWPSTILLNMFILPFGFIMVYGQQLNWFCDDMIGLAALCSAVGLFVFTLRQLYAKRPYLNLGVLRYRNYLFGLLLFIILYLARGAFNMTNNYFINIMGFDPRHLGYLLLYNICGIVIGSLISSRMVYNKMIRLPWLIGFTALLVYYGWMTSLVNGTANNDTYILPIMIQGFGTGMLMMPISLFMLVSIPLKLRSTGVALGVIFRQTSTCISVAIVNYYQLFDAAYHNNIFQNGLSQIDPFLDGRLAVYKSSLDLSQVLPDKTGGLSYGLLSSDINKQLQLRYTIDYYNLICYLLLITIIFIALYPFIKNSKFLLRTVRDFPV